jgi:hypothetical protein
VKIIGDIVIEGKRYPTAGEWKGGAHAGFACFDGWLVPSGHPGTPVKLAAGESRFRPAPAPAATKLTAPATPPAAPATPPRPIVSQARADEAKAKLAELDAEQKRLQAEVDRRESRPFSGKIRFGSGVMQLGRKKTKTFS